MTQAVTLPVSLGLESVQKEEEAAASVWRVWASLRSGRPHGQRLWEDLASPAGGGPAPGQVAVAPKHRGDGCPAACTFLFPWGFQLFGGCFGDS